MSRYLRKWKDRVAVLMKQDDRCDCCSKVMERRRRGFCVVRISGEWRAVCFKCVIPSNRLQVTVDQVLRRPLQSAASF